MTLRQRLEIKRLRDELKNAQKNAQNKEYIMIGEKLDVLIKLAKARLK